MRGLMEPGPPRPGVDEPLTREALRLLARWPWTPVVWWVSALWLVWLS